MNFLHIFVARRIPDAFDFQRKNVSRNRLFS